MVYPVSCTAVCSCVKSWGGPSKFGGGPDPPPLTLSGCALARCRIAGREFSLKNLNVTLDYFCDRPIERGSTACGKTPTSRTLGTALGDVRENPDIIPLKRANSCGGSRPPYNIWFSGPIRVYTSPKASGWFSRFYRAHGRYRHIGRPMDHDKGKFHYAI